MMIIEYTYKDIAQMHAALVAAGLPLRGINYRAGDVNVSAMFTRDLSSGEQTTAAAAVAGVGSWTLSADGTDGSVDITVSGADAACNWSVELEGVEIASEADTAAPYQVVLTAPVEAGTYTIKAVASDGTATGQIEIEVT